MNDLPASSSFLDVDAQALHLGAAPPSLLSPRPIPLPSFSPLLEPTFPDDSSIEHISLLVPHLPPPPLLRVDSHVSKALAALESVESPRFPVFPSLRRSPSPSPSSFRLGGLGGARSPSAQHGLGSSFGMSPQPSLLDEEQDGQDDGLDAERRTMREAIWRRSFCGVTPWTEDDDGAWVDEEGSRPSSAGGSASERRRSRALAGEEEEDAELVIVDLDLLHQQRSAAGQPVAPSASPMLKTLKEDLKVAGVGLGLEPGTTALLPSLAYSIGSRVRASHSSFLHRLSITISPSSSSYDGSAGSSSGGSTSSGSNASSNVSSRCASSVTDVVASSRAASSAGEEVLHARSLVMASSSSSLAASHVPIAYSALPASVLARSLAVADSPVIPSAPPLALPTPDDKGSPAVRAAALAGGGGGAKSRLALGGGGENRSWRVTADEGQSVAIWR